MNKQKLNNIELISGIDTIQIRSDTESILSKSEAPYISKVVTLDTVNKSYLYRLNPDKASYYTGGDCVYNYAEYCDMVNYMLNDLQLTAPVKTRIDYRLDSFQDNYDELAKLNKLLILLIARYYRIDNCYQSYNPLTLEGLCIRIQNRDIEIENYNKGIQEPSGIVRNRLEFRSKRPTINSAYDWNTEYKELTKWHKRLKKAVTHDNYTALQTDLNQQLIQCYERERKQYKCTVNEFIYKYRDSIFSSRQLTELFKAMGYKAPAQKAKRYKQAKPLEYFSFQDINQYVKTIIHSGNRFFYDYIDIGQIIKKVSEDDLF